MLGWQCCHVVDTRFHGNLGHTKNKKNNTNYWDEYGVIFNVIKRAEEIFIYFIAEKAVPLLQMYYSQMHSDI